MAQRILHVVPNAAHYADPSHPTGLWLAGLTHAYRVFASKGAERRLPEPKRRRLTTGTSLAQMATLGCVGEGMPTLCGSPQSLSR